MGPYGQVPTIDVQGQIRTPAQPCRFTNYCGRGEANLWIATAGAWISEAAKYVGNDPAKTAHVHRLVDRYVRLLNSDRFVLSDHTSLVESAIALAELAGELGKTWAAEIGQTFAAPKSIGVHPPPANLPIPAETKHVLDQAAEHFSEWAERVKTQAAKTMLGTWPIIALAILLLASTQRGRA